MPTVTFRDDETGEQETVTVTYHRRKLNEPDRFKPWPTRRGRRMTPIQIQYAGGQ